jgi:hypothetical protein
MLEVPVAKDPDVFLSKDTLTNGTRILVAVRDSSRLEFIFERQEVRFPITVGEADLLLKLGRS